MEIMDKIKQQVESAPIVLYMKGSPTFPQCGFSAHTVQALRACGADFAHFDARDWAVMSHRAISIPLMALITAPW